MSLPIISEVAARIRSIRKGKDFTQEYMATKLGITPGAYAKMERGETDPSLTRLKEIAVIFKTTLNELVTGQAEKSGKPAAASIPEMELLYRHLSQINKSLESIQKDLDELKKAGRKTK